jgi:hypothetical protein
MKLLLKSFRRIVISTGTPNLVLAVISIVLAAMVVVLLRTILG